MSAREVLDIPPIFSTVETGDDPGVEISWDTRAARLGVTVCDNETSLYAIVNVFDDKTSVLHGQLTATEFITAMTLVGKNDDAGLKQYLLQIWNYKA